MRMRRWGLLAGLGAAMLFGVPVVVTAQEEPSAREEALLQIVDRLGYPARLRAAVRRIVKKEGTSRELSDAQMKTFEEFANWDLVERYIAERFGEGLSDAEVDETLRFLYTEEGRRFMLERRLTSRLAVVDEVLEEIERNADRGSRRHPSRDREFMELLGTAFEAAIEAADPGVAMRGNETAAIATLRNLTSCQAQIQVSGKIDIDRDGIGEYGTFLELTGSVGVRNAALEADGPGDEHHTKGSFARQGTPVSPAILSPSLANVDVNGIVTKAGYCFRIFLPDTSMPVGFVHETGPSNRVGLAGGSGAVSVDFSETTWCAYAWPVARGNSGQRVFFVNQSGDVLQSPNEVARWSGTDHAPDGAAAFTGAGITSWVAVGTAGNDGDIWKVTN